MPNPLVAIGAIGVGGSLYGARQAGKASDRATEAGVRSQEAAIAEERAARQSFENRIRPFEQLGLSVRDPLLSSIGIGPNAYRAPEAINLGNLPAMPEAFNAKDLNNPVLDFLQKEGFRGINEGAAGGGRNPDRDLADYRAGLLTTVAPQLQQQRFNQMTSLRNQALAEQSGLRQDALSENQQRINNLLEVLGIGQSSAVGAGNAGIQSANQISSALTNIGNTQSAGALAKGQNRSDLISNLVGIGGMFAGGISSPMNVNTGGFTTQQALNPNLFNFGSRGLQ